ncbi:hypothetical protein KVR01_003732 [Diaporthe batatas]|uniref:uncharacterized protein n=1 Tax=Diaporthe batatas TaxID=748121 RepID=UPI001D054F09|nr:uncharacterized protein KVR01_003732 [Diaporthe batatas]KAG8168043.1 hypothetical protein KVR01_003732 [Diaporthe batatas]
MEAIVEALEQLLPKGIVFDSPTIYAEVAKLPVVPLEDIHRHWKTYTRTHKSLHDPTACRLENFWWHVWGSNRRNLSGKTLARIWEQIASGPTFVPLRGPPNRWEPPPKPTRSMHESDSAQPVQVHAVGSQTSETQTSIGKGAIYGLTPSSSRPPPAHTILKKPRGPSTSGPRPTARFVDVPDSEDETPQQDGGDSAGISTKKKTDVRASSSSISPAKVDRKTAPKKFVASSAASKRRPVLPRRQSSQSSTGSATASDPSPRDAASASRNFSSQQSSNLSSRDSSPSKRQNGSGLPSHTAGLASRSRASGKNPQVLGSGRESTSASSQDANFQGGLRKSAPTSTLSPASKGVSCQPNLPQSQGAPGEITNAKVLGKRPELVASPSGRKVPTRQGIILGDYDGRLGMQRSPPRSVPQSMQPTASAGNPAGTIETSRRRGAQQDKPRDCNGQGDAASSSAAPKMARSRSNNESKRTSSGGLKSSSVVGLSNIAVAGGFDFETPKARPSKDDLPPLGADQPDIRASSLLDSRLTPTEPSPNPPPPLGRSKSQLTLVLEREKAKNKR